MNYITFSEQQRESNSFPMLAAIHLSRECKYEPCYYLNNNHEYNTLLDEVKLLSAEDTIKYHEL